MPDVTPNALAQRIMARYDRNGDGTISLQGNQGPGTESGEAQAVRAKPGDAFRPSGPIVCQQTSMLSLFKEADANKDGQVTLPELKRAIAAFDRNHNGIVGDGERIKGSTATEMGLLRSSYPEQALSRTIHVEKGHARPADTPDLDESVYGEALTFHGTTEATAAQEAQQEQDAIADRLSSLWTQYRTLGQANRDMLARTGPTPGGIWGIDRKAARRKLQPTIDANVAKQAAIRAEIDALTRQRQPVR